jgi:hypothetical protein
MKKILLTIAFLLSVLYFIPAKGSAFYYPPIKGFDTLATTLEYVYSTDSLHDWFNDLNTPKSIQYPSLWQYVLSGRNFATDTMFVHFYEVDYWKEVNTINVDTVWNYTETDTSFTVYADTTWIHHWDIDQNTIDSTVIFGFNRTLSELKFYVDTLGNQNMKWQMKDTPSRVFKQVNKN